MTFVGAGIIGVEYATIFRTIGVRVTLIDGRQRPLDFIDNEVEDNLYFHMRDEGITLRFGEKVSSVQLTRIVEQPRRSKNFVDPRHFRPVVWEL